jgi:CMP-N-acetylneuraminic acid synthetase
MPINSMNRILAYDINEISAAHYLMTHATNPFVSHDTFQRAAMEYFKGIEEGSHDSLFSVNRFQSRFYWQSLAPVNHDPQNLIQTQDLPPIYEENSNFYFFNPASFLSTNARIGLSPSVYEVPKYESLDIDTEVDWSMAEAFTGLLERN